MKYPLYDEISNSLGNEATCPYYYYAHSLQKEVITKL